MVKRFALGIHTIFHDPNTRVRRIAIHDYFARIPGCRPPSRAKIVEPQLAKVFVARRVGLGCQLEQRRGDISVVKVLTKPRLLLPLSP